MIQIDKNLSNFKWSWYHARFLKPHLLILILVLCTAAFSLFLYRSPKCRSEESSPEEFSAARALRHVKAIAREPHPRGSHANQVVRDYIVREVQALGYNPNIEPGYGSWGGNGPRMFVENIAVRIVGTANTKSVLFCAHYDSVTKGPGAGDNGIAVASMLETLRVLRYHQRGLNDLIFLFTDGEEIGLIGAESFVSNEARLSDLGLVCNFDARGTKGITLMFETSGSNLQLLREISRNIPNIFATSLSTFVYKHMPNLTDFTVFKRKNIPGVNFAFISGREHYHTPTDIPSNISLDTLQHTGETMWNLCILFGNKTLPLRDVGDAVYFNLVGPLLVVYPKAWCSLMAALLVLTTIIAILAALRLKLVEFRGVVLNIAGQFGVAVVSLSVAGLVLYGKTRRWSLFDYNALNLYFCMLLIFCVAIWVTIRVSRCDLQTESLAATSLSWTGLALCCSFVLPEGSYIFFWPAASSLVGLIAYFIGLKLQSGTGSLLRLTILLLSSAGLQCAALLWSPLSYLLWTAISQSLLVVLFLFGLFSMALIPYMLGKSNSA